MSSYEFLQATDPRRFQLEHAQKQQAVAAHTDTAIRLSAEALMRQRTPEGYWNGRLTADSTLESDYILLQLWMHPPEGAGWSPPTRSRVDKACR